jgi:hypothetical protein
MRICKIVKGLVEGGSHPDGVAVSVASEDGFGLEIAKLEADGFFEIKSSALKNRIYVKCNGIVVEFCGDFEHLHLFAAGLKCQNCAVGKESLGVCAELAGGLVVVVDLYLEIGKKLGMDSKAVDNAVQRARKKLKRALAE